LTQLSISNNKISNLPMDIFNWLNSLQYLYIDKNQISTLPTNIFNWLDSLQILDIQNNCLTYDTEAEIIDWTLENNHLNLNKNNQQACVNIEYNPQITTTSQVSATLRFKWNSLKINELNTILWANQQLTFSENWSKYFNLSLLSSTQKAYIRNLARVVNNVEVYDIPLKATVTWIIPNTWWNNTWTINTWNINTGAINTWTTNIWTINTWTTNTWTINTWTTNTWTINTWNKEDTNQDNNWFSQELVDAYSFAYQIWITTQKTIKDADLEWNLIRVHMAKMMVNYAIKVLDKPINTWALCIFNDTTDQSTEMRLYIKLACQLGLMGIGVKNFNPNGIVTRAEFGTVLSRVLYWNTYNDWEFYYSNHLKILKENGIIKNDDPSLKELRGYVMLMLMRAGE